jgi:hypothetical protein
VEKIQKMVSDLVSTCEEKGMPCLVAYGLDKIAIDANMPDNTPERIQKTWTTLTTTTKQARRVVEIQA